MVHVQDRGPESWCQGHTRRVMTCPGPKGSTVGCGRPVEQPTPGRVMLRCQRCLAAPPEPVEQVQRHCTWLDDDGVICDAQLTDPDDLFCDHHPGASVTIIGTVPVRPWSPDPEVTIGGGQIQITRTPPSAPGRRLGALEASHLTALTAIGRHDKPDGLLVLYLARQLDDGQAGTAVAAISGRLMSAAQVAYAGAPPEPGELDRLRARRAQRIAALSGMDEGAGDA